jgi:hypothetical protein
MLQLELLGTPNATYNTRGLTYVASSTGIILVTNPTNFDVQDLLNSGCQFNFATAGVLLGRLIGANMNVATDQPFVMRQLSTLVPFRIAKVTAGNASLSLTTAAGGIYPAISKGGTALVASAQAYSGLTAAALVNTLTIATVPGNTIYAPSTQFWLSLTTGQGAAATADLYLWGDLFN